MSSPLAAPKVSVLLMRGSAGATASLSAGTIPPPRRILMATSGGTGADAVARTAVTLAHRHHAMLRVVTVFTDRPGVPLVGEQIIASSNAHPSDQRRAEVQFAVVKRLLAAAAGHDAGWPAQLAVGQVCAQVAEVAHASHSDLVVIGTGQPHTGKSLLDRDAVAIAASVGVPVLAVSAAFDGAPRRVMFALGLDEFRQDTAAVTLSLFPAPDSVLLANVRSPPTRVVSGGGSTEGAEAVAIHLDEVRASLEPWGNTKVEVVLLSGAPVQALLALARQRDVDLIVAAVPVAPLAHRPPSSILGLELLGHADRSVLLLPLPASTEPRSEPAS